MFVGLWRPALTSDLCSGHHDEALAVAERGRTRAFADLLVERQTGQQDSDPYTPVTVEHILDTVNGQRALVLYFSLAAGYLYSWLLAPGSGKTSQRVVKWTPNMPMHKPKYQVTFCITLKRGWRALSGLFSFSQIQVFKFSFFLFFFLVFVVVIVVFNYSDQF